MAKYEHLKLYKATFDFLLYFAKIMVHYQREYKYTVGERLMNTLVEAIVIIYKANGTKDKGLRIDYICDIQEKIQYVSILLRLSCGIGAISKDRYNNCCEYIMDIDKQLSGWKNYVIDRTKEPKESDEAPTGEETRQLQLLS